MSRSYIPLEIETKWQRYWKANQTYAVTEDPHKEKKYILVEFPYPSGSALHVGHAFRYTVPDVYSRFLRMQGYNVMFPIGYDAFGLPTEERARKDGKNPVETTEENINAFREQLERLGYGFDWSREFATTDPKYYKWTQWIFAQLFNNNLVEQKEIELWWCPNLATVLANEEVLDDPNNPGLKISERGEHPVEKKIMSQWVIKITEYAEKLLEGLELVDWPEYIKDMQRNWIGKSTGHELTWQVIDDQGVPTGDTITVFTTRLDTLPGVTFIALAPELAGLHRFVSPNHTQQVDQYLETVKNKSERERSISKEKSGVKTGFFAKNPWNGSLVPLFIADYVLSGYGTGAVMGVPAHDERDGDFASNFSLPSIPTSEEGKQINSGDLNGLTQPEAIHQLASTLGNSIVEEKTQYKLRDWVFSRQRYWGEPFPIEYKKQEPGNNSTGKTIEKSGEALDVVVLSEDQLPLLLPYVEDYMPADDGRSPLSKTDWATIRDAHGQVIGYHETDTMPNWAGSSWYFLRFTDPHNDTEFAAQDKLNYWLPVDTYFGGSEHTTLHLLYSRMWHRFLYDIGKVPTPEPYQRRINGGMLLGPDGAKMSKSLGNVINPDDKIHTYGADAFRLYINFIGPYEATVVWQEGGLKACKSMLDKVVEVSQKVSINHQDSPEVIQAINHLITFVEKDLSELKTNTCVAQLMTCVNTLKKVDSISPKQLESFIKVLSVFAPHLSEEIFEQLCILQGKTHQSIHVQSWPTITQTDTVEQQSKYVVQVDGKVRAEFETNPDTTEEELISQACSLVPQWLESREIVFTKVIHNKMVTIATKPK